MKNIKELIEKVYQANLEKGFWEKPRNLGETTALTIGEACGECLEAHRKELNCALTDVEKQELLEDAELDIKQFTADFENYVKNSMEDECADISIRIMDCIGGFFNDYKEEWETIYYRVNSDVDSCTNFFDNTIIGEWMCEIAFLLTGGRKSHQNNLKLSALEMYFISLWLIEAFAEQFRIDLELHIELKMRYNKTRPYKHNKAY